MPRQADSDRRILEEFASEIHTALPARVRAYDRATQTADVVLGCKRVARALDPDVDDDTAEAYPVLVGVPVAFPGGGGFVLAFDLRPDDFVFVVFAESSIDRYLETGEPSDPSSPARFGLEGAVVLPGGPRMRSARISGLPSEGILLGQPAGPKIEIDGSNIVAGGGDSLAIAADVRAHLQAIATALASVATAAGTTSSYVYGTTIGTNPIDTSTLKGG